MVRSRSRRFRKTYKLHRNSCQRSGMEILRFPGSDLGFEDALQCIHIVVDIGIRDPGFNHRAHKR